MNILHEACNPDMAKDRKLPYNAYLVCYMGEDQVIKHDIAMSGTATELFDTYYDKYKKGFQWLKQTEGRVTPALWKSKNEPAAPPKRKTRKKRERE